MRITIDVTEDEDLSMKDAGVLIGESGLSDVSLCIGQLEVLMTWDQIIGLHDVLRDWIKPDKNEAEGESVDTQKAPNCDSTTKL